MDERREESQAIWLKHIPFRFLFGVGLTIVVSTIGVSKSLDDKYITRAEAQMSDQRVERLSKFVIQQNETQAQMRADIASTKANTEILIKMFRRDKDL